MAAKGVLNDQFGSGIGVRLGKKQRHREIGTHSFLCSLDGAYGVVDMETERFTAFIQIGQRGEYLLRQRGRHEYIAGGQPLDNPISKLPPPRVLFRHMPINIDITRLISRRYLAVYTIGLTKLNSDKLRVGKEG